jgi:integrase
LWTLGGQCVGCHGRLVEGGVGLDRYDADSAFGEGISELIELTRADVHLGAGAHVTCHGKGRKDRITPLTSVTVTTLRNWLNEHNGGPNSPLFPTRRGLKLSRDAVEHRITHYARRAADHCPSLRGRTITAHVLRHTTRCGSCTPASTPA